ncbi:hypothetical protein HWV62_6499 [Athelia sp. TMB]|nr:hypothetical protein HWV62_6499 [Athelia sp. TMB]
MPSPPIQVFLTTIASQPALRQRQALARTSRGPDLIGSSSEYILRILHVKKIPFTSYDLASDEAAKKLWKRKAPPGAFYHIIVARSFHAHIFQASSSYLDCLSATHFQGEEAVEYDELPQFLRLNETWEDDEDRPTLPQVAVGVPGAASPAQMTPEHHKPKIFPASASDSPLRNKPVNRRTDDFDVSTELEGFGLQGVRVTEDDLAALVQELGLGGDEADDLVKGLSAPSQARKTEPLQAKKTNALQPKKSDPQVAMMAELTTKLKPKPKAATAPADQTATKVEPAETIVAEQKGEPDKTPASETQA